MMRTMWRLVIPGMLLGVSFFLAACGDDDDPSGPTNGGQPRILGIVPASGTTIPASTDAVVFTFNRPIDEDTFVPSEIGAELFWLIATHDEEPSWNQDYTVLTVSLPTPLPAGLPMWLTVAGYADTSGVVQPNATNWSVTVAGTPDYFPVIDGREMHYMGFWEEGDVGSTDPDDAGDLLRSYRYEIQDGGLFHLIEFEVGHGDWGYQIMNRTATALEMLGFQESDGVAMFDPAIDYLMLPPSSGVTWDTAADIEFSGDPIGEITADGAWVQRHDRMLAAPAKEDEPAIYWTNVWEADLGYTMSMGEDEANIGSMTLYLAPSIGLVRQVDMDEDHSVEPPRWERRTMFLVPPDMD
jgi:hypothetical protein